MLLIASIRMLSGAACPALSDEDVAARDVLAAAVPCCPAAGPDTRTVPSIRPAAIVNIGERVFVPVKGLPPFFVAAPLRAVRVLDRFANDHLSVRSVGGRRIWQISP